MKKIVIGAVLTSLASVSIADNSGPGCGWGSMLFEGQSGKASHILAATTNGTSGNNTFDMTSGTNGCDTSHKLTYSGVSTVAYHNMDQLSEEVAQGHGEILSTVADLFGVQAEDAAVFMTVMKDNYSRIYPDTEVTSQQVVEQMVEIMQQDTRLSKYVS
jgi:hypothetical protein